jgi:tripeptide aminopeptidase
MFSEATPTTPIQFDLAKVLAAELKEIGMSDVTLDKNCYVMATLPANTDKKLPTIGFAAHMDTSPDMSGKDVKPQFVDYQGGDIILNKSSHVVLSPVDFPVMKECIGKILITTDGTTLLGADDKAGIAEIMTAMEYLIEHPEIKHGKIRVGFTPDEEVGKGADHFDVKAFDADFAYTLDGGACGELEYETFNAAQAVVNIQGRNVHPGVAKDAMKNAILIGTEFNDLLPVQMRPEYTAGYEGFFHLIMFNGTVEETRLIYIIRDHDQAKFEQKKSFCHTAAAFINEKYGADTVKVEINDQYYNMREKIEPVMHIVDTAKQAMIELGIKPIIGPVRGGTDGSRFSFMGLPTPNIFTGGLNAHGKYECIPVDAMDKAVEVILKIIDMYAKAG